uniref:Uncharacterized protein n=1 Tax=viral metagenome TaxID=1070528 RepID=A0A6M3JXK0_9ZZZZ
MTAIQDRLAEVRESYERLKEELAIKKHDLNKVKEELSDMKIKDLSGAEKKLIEVENDIGDVEVKITRLLEKAEELLTSYKEEE